MPANSRLTRHQRYTIESMIRYHYPHHEIAKAIGVSNSTITRELHRNGMNQKTYCYMAAQRHAESQEWKGRRIAAELWKLVEIKLRNDQWSPSKSARFSPNIISVKSVTKRSTSISIVTRKPVEIFTSICVIVVNPTVNAAQAENVEEKSKIK
jgi:IS30 family transposase